jgi:hypothetical protein
MPKGQELFLPLFILGFTNFLMIAVPFLRRTEFHQETLGVTLGGAASSLLVLRR